MAAHVVTATRQLIDRIDANRNVDYLRMQLRAALSISSWTEQLELNEYLELSESVTAPVAQLRNVLYRLHNKYFAEWVKLGRPGTREDWHKRSM